MTIMIALVAILAAGMVPWDKVFKPSSAALAEDKRQKDEYAKRKKAAAAVSGGLDEDEGEEPVREEGEGEADKDEGSTDTWLLGGAAPPSATWLDRFE